MSKPANVDEAIQRARAFATPTYVMLADEVERLRAELARAQKVVAAAEAWGDAEMDDYKSSDRTLAAEINRYRAGR